MSIWNMHGVQVRIFIDSRCHLGSLSESFAAVSVICSRLFSRRFQGCLQRRLFVDFESILDVILGSFSELFGDRAKVLFLQPLSRVQRGPFRYLSGIFFRARVGKAS